MSRLLNDKRNRKIGNVAKIFANPVSVKIKKEVSTRILVKYIEIEKSSMYIEKRQLSKLTIFISFVETMDKIEAKAKVILPSNTNNKSLINVGSAIDKTNSNTNSLNNDKTTPNRNGEIIVLHRFSEERVISLTILSILSLILISITISFIYIYIFKKYFRQILSLLTDTALKYLDSSLIYWESLQEAFLWPCVSNDVLHKSLLFLMFIFISLPYFIGIAITLRHAYRLVRFYVQIGRLN